MSNSDPLGNLPEHQFEETLVLNPNNKKRVYILDHAPFFDGVVVKVKGATSNLEKGIDYELVYRVEQFKTAVARDLFNGIKLLKDLNGTLIIEGYQYDTSFQKPLTEQATELLRYLNEPLKTSYNNVEEKPTLFPPKPTYRPWFNIGNKQYLASSVDDMVESVANSGNDLATTIRTLKERTVQLRQAMIAVNMGGHRTAKNPHNVTVEQLNAHPVNLAAADTALAYGHDVLELVRLIRASGLKESDIAKHISRYGASGVDGTFDFVDGKAAIKSEDGLTSLTLNNGTFSFTTNGVVVLRAGYTKVAGKFLEIKTGINTLRIESSGNNLDDSKVTLNGVEFVTNRNIFDFNPEPGDGSNETIEVKATGELVKPEGYGSPSVPFKANFDPREATPTVKGKVLLGDAQSQDKINVAIAAQAVPPSTASLLPNNWTVNGKRLNANFNLTGADVGLEKVNNTSDVNKPLSTDQQLALSQISNKTHKHDTDELSIDLASVEVTGISRIARNLQDVFNLNQEISNLPTEGEIPETDLRNRMFGISHEYFEQLKTSYFNNVPDVSDVIDLRTVELSATSSAEFTVNGLILEVSGKHQYLAPLRGEKVGVKTGEIKGGVVLSNVSNEQWVSSSCVLDASFPYPVVVNNGNGNGKLIKPQGTKLTKAGIKHRFNSDYARLKITYKSNVPTVVYIDGEVFTLVENTESVLQIEIDKGEHTLAFDFSCWQVPEFYSKVELIELNGDVITTFLTDENKRFGYYDTTAAPEGRFYLYCNAGNGNVFATVGTFDNATVSTQFVYIGHVDVVNGQVVGGPKLTYRGVIDFGSVVEVEEHKYDTGAHSAKNTIISGIENVTPMGITDSDGVRVAYKSAIWHNPTSLDISDVLRRDTAISLKAKSNQVVNGKHNLGFFFTFDATKKNPAQFKSYKNDLLKQNLPVYEGCFQHYVDLNSTLKTGLVFVKQRQDKKYDVLYIDIRSSNHLRFTVPSLNTSNIVALTREGERVLGATESVQSRSCSETTGLTYRKGTERITPMSQVTYRYNPNTRSMTIMSTIRGAVTAQNTTTAQIKTVSFTEDVSTFFGSDFAGMFIEVEHGTSYIPSVVLGIAASPFPIPSELGDYRQFIDYDELFKSYLAADTVSEFTAQNNGIHYANFISSPWHVNNVKGGMTGWFGETELGTVTTSCEYAFPVCLLGQYPPVWTGEIDHPVGITIKNPVFKALNVHGKKYTYQMGVLTTSPSKTNWSVGNLPRVIYINVDLASFWNRPDLASSTSVVLNILTNTNIRHNHVAGWTIVNNSNSGGITTTHSITIQKAALNLDDNRYLKLGFVVENGAEFMFDAIISFVSSGGQVTFPFTEIAKYVESLTVLAPARGVAYYTPWHITQKTWDWYCATAKNKLK